MSDRYSDGKIDFIFEANFVFYNQTNIQIVQSFTFYIIIFNKFTMKLVIIIILLTIFSYINALRISGYYFQREKRGDILTWDMGGVQDKEIYQKVNISYRFNGNWKKASYIHTTYKNYQNMWYHVFVQTESAFFVTDQKVIDETFQWGQVCGIYFLVQQDDILQSHQIKQEIFYRIIFPKTGDISRQQSKKRLENFL